MVFEAQVGQTLAFPKPPADFSEVVRDGRKPLTRPQDDVFGLGRICMENGRAVSNGAHWG